MARSHAAVAEQTAERLHHMAFSWQERAASTNSLRYKAYCEGRVDAYHHAAGFVGEDG